MSMDPARAGMVGDVSVRDVGGYLHVATVKPSQNSIRVSAVVKDRGTSFLDTEDAVSQAAPRPALHEACIWATSKSSVEGVWWFECEITEEGFDGTKVTRRREAA